MRRTSRRVEQLTVRGLDPAVASEIRRLAATEGISLNQAAIRLLRRGAGIAEPKQSTSIGRSLDHLIGTWTRARAKEMSESIRSCEQVDAEFWE